MAFINRKTAIALAAGIYIVSVALGVSWLALKRDALQFQTRDYNYFVEQAARLTDPQLKKSFALNIEGYNMLGLQGIEGVKSLYHAIHAEYFRYTYALLYAIFHATLPLYIFYCLVFFSPILYFAARWRPPAGAGYWPILLFALLFALFPGNLYSVTSELRPRELFAAAWCLAALAVYFDRPFIEKLAFFLLLPGIREEGILFGIVIIALNFLHMQGKPGQWRQTLILLAVDLAALLAFLAFMAWGEYTRVDVNFDPRNIVLRVLSNYLLVFLMGGLLVAAVLTFFWFKRRSEFQNLLLLLVYAGILGLTGVQTLNETMRWYAEVSPSGPVAGQDIFLNVITNPSTSLLFYAGILLLVLLPDFTAGRPRQFLLAGLASLCVVFAALTFSLTPRTLAKWQQNLAPARLVWQFTQTHDRYQTNILLDYATYQAFYNFDQVIVYNRLPLWTEIPEKRYYPENKAGVARVIKKRMEFAVISRASLANVQELAQMAGRPATEVASNQQYVILQFR